MIVSHLSAWIRLMKSARPVANVNKKMMNTIDFFNAGKFLSNIGKTLFHRVVFWTIIQA
jgi:hypothetical protein